MPKTKFQSIIFTLITAWIMVYGMTLYNIILSGVQFQNVTFLIALKSMRIYNYIFVCLLYIISYN